MCLLFFNLSQLALAAFIGNCLFFGFGNVMRDLLQTNTLLATACHWETLWNRAGSKPNKGLVIDKLTWWVTNTVTGFDWKGEMSMPRKRTPTKKGSLWLKFKNRAYQPFLNRGFLCKLYFRERPALSFLTPALNCLLTPCSCLLSQPL